MSIDTPDGRNPSIPHDESDTWTSLGDAAKKVAEKVVLRRDARFRHLIDDVHASGPRPIGELISEIATAHGIQDDVMTRLERYARLDRDTVAALGADVWTGLSEVGSDD